ncbi:MAG: Stp1/IreP family PP2C-type Ser/Thr phosphatase [Rhodoferax sp.]
MMYHFIAHTDPGLARHNNEDSVAFDEDAALVVLADGMGGYNAGEIASGMASAFIKSELGRWLIEAGPGAKLNEVQRAMGICVANANLAIFNSANSNPQSAGMGTTLVMGVFRGDQLLVGHIGDSRCYRFRAGQFDQITKDHSLLQEQIDAGLITPEEASTSSIKNLVTRALGVEEVVELEINSHRVEAGDLYLLCSDGLSDMLDDGTIAKIIANHTELGALAAALIHAANENGGRDNISVILAQAQGVTEKRGLIARWLGKS